MILSLLFFVFLIFNESLAVAAKYDPPPRPLSLSLFFKNLTVAVPSLSLLKTSQQLSRIVLIKNILYIKIWSLNHYYILLAI